MTENDSSEVIDFWFSIGSTYTYLTVMRLADVEREHNVRFNLRPFSVRAILGRIGNVPFVGKEQKMRYMWRDIERRAASYGYTPSLPAAYPLENFDLANQVAVLANQQGWCAEYLHAAYKAWFHDGLMAGSDENLAISIAAAGKPVAPTIVEAGSAAVTQDYEDATEDAWNLGIFGAPSFVVDGAELFWGDDRLEDAVNWAKR